MTDTPLPERPIHVAGPWITEHEVNTVLDAMRSGWYDRQAYYYVETFQKEFARRHGRKYGIMTPSCTTAIHLLMTGLGIRPGDEVIVPDLTWIASAAPVTYLGASTVFADADPDDWCSDPASIERCITPRTKAVLVVDHKGNMPRMDEIMALCERAGVLLIEDAAQAVGSKYRGKPAGSFGVGSVFSFHRTKTITTGEGGMLLLDDDKLYERCMFLRDHGRDSKIAYWNTEVTFKYMPSNLAAALGYAQLQRLEELVERKRWIFQRYKELLADIPDIQLNAEPAHVFNSVWVTGLVVGHRYELTKQRIMEAFQARGVPPRPFFYPLSSMPAYAWATEKYQAQNPVAYDISSRGVDLPCALDLSEAQLVRISEVVHEVLLGRQP